MTIQNNLKTGDDIYLASADQRSFALLAPYQSITFDQDHPFYDDIYGVCLTAGGSYNLIEVSE